MSYPANPHATRLTLILADVIVLLIVVTVLPMLWVGDWVITLLGRGKRCITKKASGR